MFHRNVLRLMAVVATTAALLVMTAGPASASTTVFAIVGGGLLLEDANGDNDIELPLDGESPCEPAEVSIDASASPARWLLVDWITKILFPWLFPGPWLIVMELSSLNGADQDGSYDDPSAGDVGPLSVGLQADFSPDEDEDCEPDDEPVCSFYFEIELDGTYTGSAPNAITGFDLEMTTTTPLTPISEGCPAPLAAYIDGAMSGNVVGSA